MSTETILVVDDTVTIRQQEQSVLEKAGYRVLTAPDGETAQGLRYSSCAQKRCTAGRGSSVHTASFCQYSGSKAW